MNLTSFIARRYLFSKKSHNAINIVTGISVACVAVVTAALIIIMSAMNGLSDLVESLYNTFHSDIRITPVQGKTFVLTPAEVAELKKIPGVAWYTGIVDENALIEYNDRQLIVTMRGVGDDYVKDTHFDDVVQQGFFDLHPNGSVGTVVGEEIASRLDLDSMGLLDIYVPKRGKNLLFNPANTEDTLFNRQGAFVAGVYSVSSDFDGKYIILPADVVRRLLDYKDECTSAEMGVKKDFSADDVIVKVKNILGKQFLVQSRFQQNEILFRTLQSEKMWTFIILLFILFIATFNTIGSLTLLIIEKKKDIGVLWSMGADRSTIRKIFFMEGLFISVFGTLIGIVLGLVLCFLQQKFGFIRFSKGFVVDAYPVTVVPVDLLYIVAAVTAIGLLAAWYPVRVYTKRYQTIRFNG